MGNRFPQNSSALLGNVLFISVFFFLLFLTGDREAEVGTDCGGGGCLNSTTRQHSSEVVRLDCLSCVFYASLLRNEDTLFNHCNIIFSHVHGGMGDITIREHSGDCVQFVNGCWLPGL